MLPSHSIQRLSPALLQKPSGFLTLTPNVPQAHPWPCGAGSLWLSQKKPLPCFANSCGKLPHASSSSSRVFPDSPALPKDIQSILEAVRKERPRNVPSCPCPGIPRMALLHLQHTGPKCHQLGKQAEGVQLSREYHRPLNPSHHILPRGHCAGQHTGPVRTAGTH